MVLVLTRNDLEKILFIEDAMNALERAFAELAQGHAVMPGRSSIPIRASDGWLGVMPAYLEETGSVSTKIVSVFPSNLAKKLPTIYASIILNDPKTGETIAVLEGSYITALRTGGLGGVAAKYLSRVDSKIASIFGTGVQARTQLQALLKIRKIERVKIYDPAKERMDLFAKEMGDKLKIDIEKCNNPDDALSDSDVIITVSTASTPLFDGRLVKRGAHINAFGNYKPNERELDSYIVANSKIVVDQKDASLSEAGDIIIPLKEGAITKDNILAELGEVITGSKKIRADATDITIFKSVGLAIQDCAVATLAYRKAVERGMGTKIELDK